MSYYAAEITTLLLKDILLTALKKKLDTISTIDVETEEKDAVKKYFVEDGLPKEIEVKEDVKLRVFDVSDINWEAAEKDIFLSLNWNDLKIGEVNEMENVVRNLVSMSSQNDTLSWLNQLYLDHNKNVLFVCTLLHTLSHMEYEETIPHGPTMAMASLNHEDDRVIGYAIKAFSNWNSKNTIGLMETNVPNIPWARKEWNRVLEYIKEYGDENNELLNENDKSDERVDTRTL